MSSRSQALNKLMIVIGLLLILLVSLESPAAVLQHNLQVELIPGLKMIKAQDTITFPADVPRKLSFVLNKNLSVSVKSVDDTITALHEAKGNSDFIEYGIELSGRDNKITLAYQGVLNDPIVNQESSGLIANEGAALFGSTYWYPDFLGHLKSFEITVKTPQAWQSLVQGQLASLETRQGFSFARFAEIYPQEEIYLVAGPFQVVSQDLPNGKKIQILLRGEDKGLSRAFLNVIPDYIRHYSETIAPYPYPTFSVVENFWETGYGMPSFTLLGPTVIRLPFILNSSLPHEILHNWWGNSVFVDYDKGNWSEGLTTYMADYWQQELAGQDRDYRLSTLISYNDYVAKNPEKDFPISQFRGRHNSSSQAVGYGKTMMFFHMLEQRLGKDIFKKSLQDFYQDNIFKKASFADIQKSFEKVSGQNLTRIFQQWIETKGAPKISLLDVRTHTSSDGLHHVTYTLSQMGEVVYDLNLPVVWTLENGETVRQIARLTTLQQSYSYSNKVRPVTLAVDPDHNVFRALYPEEKPATLSEVLGSAQLHFYFDGTNTESQKFVASWKQSIDGEAVLHSTDEIKQPSNQGALVLVGDATEFRHFMQNQLRLQDFSIDDQFVRVNGEDFSLTNSSFALVIHRDNAPQQSIVWVKSASANNMGEWAGRLTHYGKFGVLIFRDRPVVLKSTWPTKVSPLKKTIP